MSEYRDCAVCRCPLPDGHPRDECAECVLPEDSEDSEDYRREAAAEEREREVREMDRDDREGRGR